jgi:undecaprenyl-diphosphatase
METTLLARLDARDRALYARWALDQASARAVRWALIALTHVGGATSTILLCLLPLLRPGLAGAAGWRPLASLVFSHLVVQVIKRRVGRVRPSRALARAAAIHEPDRFSFPSGHSAAAMSTAIIYAVFFPVLAAPILVVATAIGLTRVLLGVHYPGDVLVGQAIAIASALVVLAL